MGRIQMPHHPLRQPEQLCLHLWVGGLFRFHLKKEVPGNGRPGPVRVSRPLFLYHLFSAGFFSSPHSVQSDSLPFF